MRDFRDAKAMAHTLREALLRLEAAGANHLAPFLGFVGDQFAEIGR